MKLFFERKYIRLYFVIAVMFKMNMIAQQQPNILFIVTDDQRYDSVEAFNEILHGRKTSRLYNPQDPTNPNWGYVESPNVNQLVQEGTTFINTYCQAMGCAPSRASMYYGRYPFRSGVYEFEYHNKQASHTRPTIFEELKSLGYQTMHSGKLGLRRLQKDENGKILGPQVFDTDINDKYLAEQGFTDLAIIKRNYVINSKGEQLTLPARYRLEILIDNDGTEHYVSEELEALADTDPKFAEFKGAAQRIADRLDLFRIYKQNQGNQIFKEQILAGLSPRWKNLSKDGYITSSFISFLKNENRDFKFGDDTFKGVDTSKPLFSYVGYTFPHTPVLPANQFRAKFNTKFYNVPTVTQEELNTMPKQLNKAVTRNWFSDHYTPEEKQQMIRDYYAFCAHGDYQIGRSVSEFKAYSEKHNQPWLIVYVCGDHGWKLNEHGSISKFTPWELDSHNPIVVVSSNKNQFNAGKVVNEFAEFVDIVPTMLKAAGANIHDAKYDHLDGKNLAWLAKSPTPLRDYVVGESHAVVGPRAYIRTKEYNFSMQTRPDRQKGLDNIEWALDPSRALEDIDAALYHVTVDPDEKVNLIKDPKYAEVAEALREKLGRIVLGDRRAEINWGTGYTDFEGTDVRIYDFARGAHNSRISLPSVAESKEILATLEQENKNVVYPNPVSEGLIILGDRFEGKQFTISNMLGSTVINKTYKGGFVDVSSLTAGVYVLSIAVSDEVQVVEKLIVE